MGTWVANLLDYAESIQKNILEDFPEDLKKTGYGRAAKLIVDGKGGGEFDLWFCEQGLRPKPDDVVIRNIVYMKEGTFADLVIPDIEIEKLADMVEAEGIGRSVLKLYPRLDFRTALANDLIVVSGDKPDIDSEEWSRILETAILKVFFPVVIEALLDIWKERVKHG